MNLQYRLIQYVPDMLRQEGRNIAIIAYDGQRAYFKAIGLMDDGTVDLDYYKTIAPHISEDVWAFGEWINWFQDLIALEGHNPEKLNASLNKLEKTGINIIARQGGEVIESDEEEVSFTIQKLYDELVTTPPKPRIESFIERAEQAVILSKITELKGFERDVEVELRYQNSVTPLFLEFPFLLNAEPRTGFKLVQLRHRQIHYVTQQVHDAIYTFQNAVDLDFLKRDRCVVLCDRPTREKERYIAQLSPIAHLIDISGNIEKAGKRIQELSTVG
jgi:hypothetical protein